MMTILNSKHTLPVTNISAVSNAVIPGQLHGISPLTVGQVYTSTSSYNWSNPTSPSDNILTVQNNPASLDVKGKMVLNGRDLEERLTTIEKVLRIPERDVILEKKHPKLKKLYNEYIYALAKYRTFEAIKGE